MNKKSIVFKIGSNPVATGKIIVFKSDNVTYADTSNATNGYEVLNFIKNNIGMIDHDKQHDHTWDQHEISKSDFKPSGQRIFDVRKTLSEWLLASGFDLRETEFSYHNYLEIKVDSEELIFDKISISDLLSVQEDSSRYFYSLPFLKRLIKEYGYGQRVRFEYAQVGGHLSIGFEVLGRDLYFNISYNPPIGNPTK